MRSSRSSSSGSFPNLSPTDVIDNGEALLFRNPQGVPFGERDAWGLAEDWRLPDGIPSAYSRLLAKESRIAAENSFAWNEQFGYLSPFPEHCGTGLIVRAHLHLEALNLIGDLPLVLNGITAVRFNADGVNMDGIKNAAHLFDIYNNSTLGISEENLLDRAARLFRDIIQQELNARIRLVRELPRVLEDSVSRAIAILQRCRLLSPWEYLDIISPIRLATVMGFLDGITRAEADSIMRQQLAVIDDFPNDADGDRMRDERDAHLADAANKRFARVRWNSRAKEYLI